LEPDQTGRLNKEAIRAVSEVENEDATYRQWPIRRIDGWER